MGNGAKNPTFNLIINLIIGVDTFIDVYSSSILVKKYWQSTTTSGKQF